MHVLCVTPNVAVDRTLEVPGFRAGGVWRAAAVGARCGGKGVNVARAVRALGHRASSAGLVAGHSGRLAAESAAGEGLPALWTWVPGESRTCVIVVGGDGETTVINEPGGPITPLDWVRLEHDVADLATGCDAVCISGSLPPGAPPGGLARLIGAARAPERALWIDCAGAALAEAVSAGGAGIKINAVEAAALSGRPITGAGDAARAAAALSRRTRAPAAITLGGDGAVLAAEDGVWHARPPAVGVVSAVGSGDCFLAGLVLALGTGSGAADALCRAVAAGTANACRAVAGDVDRAVFARILEGVEAARLKP